MNSQLKKGALELCVLSVLADGDCYGYDLVTRISEHVTVTEGTIYPLLRRLKEDGQVETYLQESTSGPPRKYYSITEHGRDVLKESVSDWNELVSGVYAIILNRRFERFTDRFRQELDQAFRGIFNS